MQFLSAGLFALAALFVGTSASPMAAVTYPPPASTYIKSVSYAGTGCPAGSVVGKFSPNYDNIHIAFDNFVASVGPGIPFAQKRKNCQLIFTIAYPAGWSYTISETIYKGYVDLNYNVVARQQSEYWFQGQESNVVSWYDEWKGKLVEDYTTLPDKMEKEVWSPCRKASNNLIINTQVRVDNSMNTRGSGMITTDSLTHKVTHVFTTKWKRC